MRTIAGIFAVVAAFSVSTASLVYAQNQNDSSTTSDGHVKQHQQVVPQNDSKDSSKPESRQSAQAPQSPAVIAPPTTGDKSVITPPAEGVAKMPVIKPPGTTGNQDEVKPQ